MAKKQENYQEVYAKNREEFRAWLTKNHEQKEAIWLILYKRKSDQPTIKYNEAVEEAICFGWIDSKKMGIDEERYKLVFSPREPKSLWSRSNKKRVERLLKQNQITVTGLKTIAIAKKNGTWTWLDDIEDLVVPTDLAQALMKNRQARQYYEGFNDASKKAILLWIKSAKRAGTRKNRIQKTVDAAAKNIKAVS